MGSRRRRVGGGFVRGCLFVALVVESACAPARAPAREPSTASPPAAAHRRSADAPVGTSSPSTPTVDEVLARANADLAGLPVSLPPGARLRWTCCVMTSVAGAPFGAPLQLVLPLPAPLVGEASVETGHALGFGASYGGQVPALEGPFDRDGFLAAWPTRSLRGQRDLAVASAAVVRLGRPRAWADATVTAQVPMPTSLDAAHVYFRAISLDGDIDTLEVVLDASANVVGIFEGPSRTRVR